MDEGTPLQVRAVPLTLDLVSRICYELEQTYYGKPYADKLRDLWNAAKSPVAPYPRVLRSNAAYGKQDRLRQYVINHASITDEALDLIRDRLDRLEQQVRRGSL